MVHSSSVVKCLLCQASLNLSRGSLDKFKHHLETVHESVFDLDLVISVSFLETEEKERIVETVFPRIKKFFLDMKISNQDTRLEIEKRLLEDEEISGISALYETTREKESRMTQNTALLTNLRNSIPTWKDQRSLRTWKMTPLPLVNLDSLRTITT